MWQTYRNEIIIGLVLGLIVIGLGFLVSTNWVLRVILMTVVLVGEGIYFLRILGIIGQTSSTPYPPMPRVAVPAQSKNAPGRYTGGKKKSGKSAEEKSQTSVGSSDSWQDLKELVERSEALPEAKMEVAEEEMTTEESPKSDLGLDDEVTLGTASNPEKPLPSSPPPAPTPIQPDLDMMVDKTEEEELAEEVSANTPSDDEDLFGTGVFDDDRDIDLDAVEAYRRARGESSSQDTSVHFSAYYPKEVKANDWQPLHAYIYRKFVETQVQQDVEDKLGEKMARFRQSAGSASQEVVEGATIAVTPYLPGFQFNPPVAIIGFYKDWHHLDFEVRALDAPLNQASNGRITFTVEGVIVGDIPLSIFVGETVSATSTIHVTQKIYQAIFASYSH